MKRLKILMPILCFMLIGSVYSQTEPAGTTGELPLEKMSVGTTGTLPPETKNFAAKNEGPKCARLEELGRNAVDSCMQRAPADRAKCVEDGKKQFIGLLMSRFGNQCRFVIKILSDYAKSVGLEVDEGKGPERVATGPNPDRICPMWESNAKRVIGECGRMKPEQRLTCGQRAVGMFLAEIANQPNVFKICPNLEGKVGSMADAAFGKDLSQKLGDRFKDHHQASTKPNGCHSILAKFKGGIDKCASASDGGACLGKLKAEGDKVFNDPKNEKCSYVGDALFRYAYSKPNLRVALDTMRDDKVKGPEEKKAVAQTGPSKQCLEIEKQAIELVDQCAAVAPEQKFNCTKKIYNTFQTELGKAGGCGDLEQKIGNYAGQKGLPDPHGGMPQAPKTFADKNKGPDCGELEEWGRDAVDSCMAKPSGDRKKCVQVGKTKFMNLMMNDYGPQCRHVGEIVIKYADSVDLDVHEGKGPRKVAKGPNPNRLCPTWKQNAEKVIGECARKKPRFREACGEIAVNMFLSEIARQPKIFSLCPKLEDNIKDIAGKAFGTKLNEKLGEHYEEHQKVAVGPGGCHALLETFKKGINKCAAASNPAPCLGYLKAEVDKTFSIPKNKICGPVVADGLFSYGVSKPTLQADLNKMRHGPKRRVAVGVRTCKRLGRKIMKKIDNCASEGPKEILKCSRNIKKRFDEKSKELGGCQGLGDKIGDYARSKGLPDPDNGPTHLKASAVASVKDSGDTCGIIEADLRTRINNCASKKDPAKRLKCSKKIKNRIDKRSRRAGGCGNLGDKLGEYARSKGLPDLDKGPLPKIAKPATHGEIPLVKGGKKCGKFISWMKTAVSFCMKKTGDRREKCKNGSLGSIGVEAGKKNFSQGECPGQWDSYENLLDKLEE